MGPKAQSYPFYGFEEEDPHSHIRRFYQITRTLRIYQVPHDVVKLILFSFSLKGAAETWLDKEPPNSITSWDDLVSKFLNRFYPHSKTRAVRREITDFQQVLGETFTEAWERFNDLLKECPHHGFSLLHQINSFYSGLSQSDQDFLNTAAGGNLMTKNTQEALIIIKRKASVQNYRNKYVQEEQGVQKEQEEQAAQSFTPYWNFPMIDDDDDKYTIQYREYLENSSKAITPEEPEDSLIMGDEHLDTIPEKESDELIKSSVENLVSIPCESEDFSDLESECDVPVYDDSSPSFTTFANPLFDSNDDFTSSDDKSLSNEDVPMENFKIYSNPLFDEEIISTKIDPHYFNVESNLIKSLLNRDTLIDSSPKIDYLLEEFSGELAHIDPIPPGIKETDFDLEEEIRLVENLSYDNSSPRPPEEHNVEIADTIVESLSSSPNPVEDSDSFMEEIDIFLASDDSTPPGVESDYDSERDIIFLEELLNDDLVPLSKYNHFTFDVKPDTTVKNDFDELNEDECY
ncbi:ribonuclease H-like domain-containing protein [Tanacetum coccineum]